MSGDTVSRTLVLGDTHIWNHKWCGGPLVDGVNRRCREIIDSILETVDWAKRQYGITSVVQLGDFFDGPKPSPAVLDIAIRMIQETGVPWHIIAGNHDITSYDAPSAIAPMGHVDGIHTYEKPTLAHIDGQPWAMIPYTGPSADKALQDASGILSKAVYAAVHYGFVYNTGNRPDLINREQWRDVGRQVAPTHIPPTGYFGHEHNSRTSYVCGESLGAFTQSSFSDTDSGRSRCAVVPVLAGESYGRYGVVGPRFFDLTAVERLDLRTIASYSQYALGYPIYILVRSNHIGDAETLLAAGIIRGYKVKSLFETSGTGSGILIPMDAVSSTPMDVVYTVTGSTSPADILEDVVAILEQDMQE